MKVRELAVPGAFEFTPTSYHDDRGLFVAPYVEPVFVEAVGHPMRVAQTNHSVSRRGVVRGVHFADVPPGQAKYVYCPVGALLDVVVDLRVGSPSFGQVDTVYCDDTEFRAVYVPEGVGHAFVALADTTVMSYLCTVGYRPVAEHTISPFDPDLALPWPADIEPILSDRDAEAPSLIEAMTAGILPTLAACQTLHL
jgi:5-epimerase